MGPVPESVRIVVFLTPFDLFDLGIFLLGYHKLRVRVLAVHVQCFSNGLPHGPLHLWQVAILPIGALVVSHHTSLVLWHFARMVVGRDGPADVYDIVTLQFLSR